MRRLILFFLLCLTVSPAYADTTITGKGLAMADPSHPEDLTALNVSWRYMWGEYCPADDARCVNMVRSMQLPQACYPVLLVGNEPNALEPNGFPVTPAEAVEKVKAIQAQCPNTKLVVGNVSADDWSVVGGYGSGLQWLKAFLKAYPTYSGGIGVHCFTQHSAQWCISQLRSMRRLYRGEMWVTEGNCLGCSTYQFGRLADYAKRNFMAWAFWTNRQPLDENGNLPAWGIPGTDMVRADGSLTELGLIYSTK